MESYKDDYPSHAKGICQEAIQNSVDARQAVQSFKDLTVVIEYDPQQRVLRVRDYGTTGMSHCSQCRWGIKENGDDCHEKDCKWGNFHYLGGLAKSAGELGSRGQGKSLAIVAGRHFVVRTKLVGPENLSMASRWTRDKDEWYWELDEALTPKQTDKAGTELIIDGVVDEVHNQLLNTQEMKEDIGRTWFRVLEKGATIRFGYVGKELQKISAPRWPGAADPENKHSKRRKSIPISVNRAIVGELENLEIFLAEEPVPEEIRGIALIRNGTQVIERINSWGRKVSIDLQDRVYGWVTYHTSEKRPFLNVCERPGHRGYRPHIFYRRAKENLQQQVEELALPFTKQQLKPKLTEKDRVRAQQNLSIVQLALGEVGDFNPWSGDGSIKRARQKRPIPETPYISEIHLDKDRYARGDEARVTVVILNPTRAHQPYLHLTVEALDPGLSPLAVKELPPVEMPLMKPGTEDEKGRIAPEATFRITEDFVQGKNWVRCTLLNRPPATQIEEGEQPLDRGSHALWVETDPVKHTRGPPTGGSKGDESRPGTLRGLQPISDAPASAGEPEILPFWDDGEIWFFTQGPRLRAVYESDPRTADSILFELISEVVAERILLFRLEGDARESYDKTQLTEEFKKLEDSRRRFLKACERFRAKAEDA